MIELVLNNRVVQLDVAESAYVKASLVSAIRLKERFSSLLINSEWYEGFLRGSVAELLAKSPLSEQSLKEKIILAGLNTCIRTAVKELSSSQVCLVLQTYLECLQTRFLHLKFPSDFMDGLILNHLQIQARIQGFCLLIEDNRCPPLDFLDSVHDEEISRRSPFLPETLSDSLLLQKRQVILISALCEACEGGAEMHLGNLHFFLDLAAHPSLLGLIHQSLILCLTANSFEISLKEKERTTALDIIAQGHNGQDPVCVVSISGQRLILPLPRRAPTKKVYLRILWERVLLFQPDSKKRIHP